MSLRNAIGSLLQPETRGRLVEAERQLQHAFTKYGVARVVRPFMMRSCLARPEEIDIEVTSNCDADCIMCPRRSMRRKPGAMDFGLFKKIVDEAVELDVKELYLNGYGEISTLKNYRDYVCYIRQKSRSVKIIINSNGMRMHEELARLYVEQSVHLVNVTIDGATAATFESIRRHLKLDQVEHNVKQLIALRKQMKKRYPMVSVQMIHMPQNKHEVDLFLAKWRGVADFTGISGLVSRLSSVSFVQIQQDNSWQQTPCSYLWRQMPIWSDGTVALCCDDWDGKGELGNLNHDTIKNIWNNPERKRLREIHMAGRSAEIKLCDDCRQPREGPWWFQNKVVVPEQNCGREQ
jgi:radical SAM protein with 4Fe4S-binding SPASM domain